MKEYPDWAPGKKKRAVLHEEEPAAPAETEQPAKAEPPRECPACRVPLQPWEEGGFLMVYQAMSRAMPRMGGVPHYYEADLYVCPCCGRYEFFRPADQTPENARYEAFRRCSDQQLQAIASDRTRSEEMRRAAREILDYRAQAGEVKQGN